MWYPSNFSSKRITIQRQGTLKRWHENTGNTKQLAWFSYKCFSWEGFDSNGHMSIKSLSSLFLSEDCLGSSRSGTSSSSMFLSSEIRWTILHCWESKKQTKCVGGQESSSWGPNGCMVAQQTNLLSPPSTHGYLAWLGRLAGEGRCQGSLPCLTITVTASLGCRLAEKVNQLTSERLEKTIPASIPVQPLIVPPSNARTQRPGCAMIIACADGHVQVSAH